MKRLGNPPTEIQASGFRSPRGFASSETVLGGKGSLRRGKLSRALAACAPLRRGEPLGGAKAGSEAVSSSCERREPGCS